jgi:hypothetical protein
LKTISGVGSSIFPSSSFIEPPATGHHQWSGAKRFSIFSFYNTFYITQDMMTTFSIKRQKWHNIHSEKIRKVLAIQKKHKSK